jgi:hypothetical protein
MSRTPYADSSAKGFVTAFVSSAIAGVAAQRSCWAVAAVFATWALLMFVGGLACAHEAIKRGEVD